MERLRRGCDGYGSGTLRFRHGGFDEQLYDGTGREGGNLRGKGADRASKTSFCEPDDSGMPGIAAGIGGGRTAYA